MLYDIAVYGYESETEERAEEQTALGQRSAPLSPTHWSVYIQSNKSYNRKEPKL